ncbi:prepilin-type N-terminal cleavage/methylation domain-containing protein [Parasalinivibrio latis]|uniref:pilus assembly FimT family protein n=1 Tax=Parasalinivibrio latis TaxID=2952610 RepID=UPI0030E3B1FC
MCKNCGALRGFTLIELLVSLTVLTVLSMAAAPSFLAAHESLQVTRATEEVQLFLAMVKSEAVMRNEKVTVYFDTSSPWALTAKLPDNTEIAKLDGSNFSAVVMEPTIAGVTHLFADPIRGVLTSSAGNSGGLRLYKVNERTAEVKYSRTTGRIRICSPEKAYGYDKC